MEKEKEEKKIEEILAKGFNGLLKFYLWILTVIAITHFIIKFW